MTDEAEGAAEGATGIVGGDAPVADTGGKTPDADAKSDMNSEYRARVAALSREVAALRESEFEHRTLFETMVQGVIYQDATGHIIAVNPAAEAILGMDIEQLRIHTPTGEFNSTGHADGLDFAGETHASMVALKMGSPVTNVVMAAFHPMEQKYHWIIIDAVPQFRPGEQRPYRVYTIFSDITERAQAEMTLHEAEQRYRTLFEGVPVGLYRITPEGRFIAANRALIQMLGYPDRETLLKVRADEINVNPEDRQRAQALNARDGGVQDFDMQLRRYGGEVIWVRDSARIVQDTMGKALYFEGSLRDITAEKRKEEELKLQLMKFNLEEGTLYMVREATPNLAQETFRDLLKVGYGGLVVSRVPAKKLSLSLTGNYEHWWVAEQPGERHVPPDVKALAKLIDEYRPKGAVYIDLLDFLIFKLGFDASLTFVQHLREQAYLIGHIIILTVDSTLIKGRNLLQLEKETAEVTPRFGEHMDEGVFDVMRFTYQQNREGIKPSYSEIGEALGISKPTVRKRVRHIISRAYAREFARGSYKTLELTEMGIRFFQS